MANNLRGERTTLGLDSEEYKTIKDIMENIDACIKTYNNKVFLDQIISALLIYAGMFTRAHGVVLKDNDVLYLYKQKRDTAITYIG